MLCPRCSCDIPDDALICCYCGRTIIKKKTPRAHQRGNGAGTAWRRGKTWTAISTIRCYIDDDGNRHQVRKTKGGFKTKNEALEYCRMLKYGTPTGEKKILSLEEYWQIYRDGELLKLSASKQ